jgi:hypothetical protein
MPKMKIIFMGTPDFAVPALKALHKNSYNVVLVVTQPDRPKENRRVCKQCDTIKTGHLCCVGLWSYSLKKDSGSTQNRRIKYTCLTPSKISGGCANPVGYHKPRKKDRGYHHAYE